MSTTINKYLPQLDGLRFYAVLMVMIAHWLQWKWEGDILLKLPFSHGVILFFVLSGFLITRILLHQTDKYNQAKVKKTRLLRQFYIRRFLRIFPIYYLLILFLAFINFEKTRELLPWLLSYSSNIYQSITNSYVGYFNHFWSLAVEEQFYLFWPFVILFITPKKRLLPIVLTILGSLLLKSFIHYNYSHWMATAYFTTNCMHALGLGALLAYIQLYKPNWLSSISSHYWLYGSILFYGIFLALRLHVKLGGIEIILDDFLFAIVAMFIINRASTSGFKGFGRWLLTNKIANYCGKISYGLYVYHLFMQPLYYYLAPKISLTLTGNYELFLAFFILTFIVSFLSYKIIEQPINNLKKRFPYYKK